MKVLVIFALALLDASAAEDYFKITVIDEKTGRGVPLAWISTALIHLRSGSLCVECVGRLWVTLK